MKWEIVKTLVLSSTAPSIFDECQMEQLNKYYHQGVFYVETQVEVAMEGENWCVLHVIPSARKRGHTQLVWEWGRGSCCIVRWLNIYEHKGFSPMVILPPFSVSAYIWLQLKNVYFAHFCKYEIRYCFIFHVWWEELMKQMYDTELQCFFSSSCYLLFNIDNN